MSNALCLAGINGANPLGFLAALGTLSLVSTFSQRSRLAWGNVDGMWRPFVSGVPSDNERFLAHIAAALKASSSHVFEIDPRLPFDAASFGGHLARGREGAAPDNRRDADLLAAFGSEVIQTAGVFESTAWRMVRSGDAAGQGLPAYAVAIRKATGLPELRRTLFHPWTYEDRGFSLRWDPGEDGRYALRWRNPSKDKPRIMLGANALALEALALFPTAPRESGLQTTGFSAHDGEVVFTWPIWDSPLDLATIRSVLTLPDLHRRQPPRRHLLARGIVEVYRCVRMAPNQYYKNFTPATPV